MRTVFASLPFYDSVVKQDRNRSSAVVPIHCPRTQLPPFLIAMGTGIATVNTIKLVSCDGSETDISSYFSSMPHGTITTTSALGLYIQYNGDVLKTVLPGGSYYVKVTKSDAVYYSDWIRIMDVSPKIVTSLSGEEWDGLQISGTTILSAEDVDASYTIESNTFTVSKGENIYVFLYFTHTSGQYPSIHLYSGGIISNTVAITSGLNIIILTATSYSATAVLQLANTASAKWSTSEIITNRNYSPKFIRIDFRNTNNLGDIRYENAFSQTVWLEAILNNPTHEIVNTGEEKDGIFIAEKIVSKYIYSVICYVSRGLYNCLMRLPQHDTITITDEVGNTYTPDVGNVTVEPAEWTYFDLARVVIKFNDSDRSNFSWVK